MSLKLTVYLLGVTDYQDALVIQEKLLTSRQTNQIGETLILLEHPPVITVGKKGNRSNIVVSERLLASQGARIYEVNRGGDVTYHGPGQIVGYPFLDLQNFGKDIRQFVRNVEEVFIQLLKNEYNIIAKRDPQYTGVWVEDKKITAIGFAIKRWVTMHGFAFNVNTQLEHFNWIIPCGIVGKGVTSLAELLGRPLDWNKVNNQVVDYFCRVFNLEPQILTGADLDELIGSNKHAKP